MNLQEAIELITSGRAPQGLTLHLGHSNIGAAGAASLSEALSSGNAPQGLTLGLERSNIGTAGAASLSQALSSGNAPQGLTLHLGDNNIGAAGAASLFEALSSGHAPQGLTLNLGCNYIGAAGATSISAALSSGNAPQGLALKLGGNNIGDTGATSISEALSSGNAPQGLILELRGNNIGAVGAASLSEALSSGNAPQGLTLDLRYNNIGDVGVNHLDLVCVINQGLCPVDLKINGIPEVEVALEREYLKRTKHLAEACLNLAQPNKVIKKDGSVIPLKRLSRDIVSYIASYVHPKGKTIGGNASSFFYVREVSISPLTRLKINASKVGEILNISDAGSIIQKIIKSYLFNSYISPRAKEAATKSLLSALQNIDTKEAQTLVSNEIATLTTDTSHEVAPISSVI